MSKKIIPSEKIVICEEVSDSMTDSKLAVNYNATKDKPELGKIIAIGAGKQPVKMVVGDIIAFEKYVDNRIRIGVKKYNFVKFEHIVGVVKEEE